MDNINDVLDDYENNSLNKVVKDDINNVETLQQQFNDFMDQQFKKRRDADDLSVSLTGFTNQQRYENQMKDLVQESAILDISRDKIEIAKRWSFDSNIQLMYPCDNIEQQFAKYLSQPNDLRRMADWKALDLFGIDNINLYKMLKRDLGNIEPDKENDINALGEQYAELSNRTVNTFTEAVEINHLKNNILKQIKKLSKQDEYKCEFMYVPYFDPKEIMELEGYYSDIVEDGCNEVFKEYVNYFYGYENKFNPIEWYNMVNRLSYKLEYAKDINESNILKQSLITIGWNPEIKFTAENQLNAKNRHESIIKEMYKNVSMLNLQSQFNAFNESEAIQESKKQKLHPISVVLVRGDSKFSDLIVKVTNGPFSHSALCIDNDFKRLYSFNAHHYSNEDGGFSLEDIKYYPQDNNIAVFTFFVDDKQYNKINDNIQSLLYDIQNTKYSMLTAITIPFKKINLNMNAKMICSQFVDKMLKLANIDITGMDSSKVTPNYLYSCSIGNSKIYKIYEGPAKDFNYNKATKFVDSLSRKSKSINESADIFYEYTIGQYLYPVVSEARKLPVEITHDGDILLSNPKIDFEAEYSASHKLLLQYDEANNYESMKYELARLYYMNYLLEKRINNNKFKNNKDKNIKTRARILNDFNKYIKIILKKDSTFNFAQYYEASPFYANTIEIKKGTIKGLKSLINYIL